MMRGFALAGLAPAVFFGSGLSAVAQEVKLEARATTAASAIDNSSPLAPAGPSLLADAELAMTRTDTLKSGLQLTWRGEIRIERDAASRPGFAGVLGACPAAASGCPAILGAGSLLSPISPTTGLAASGPRADKGVFATLESASLSASGPWGEGEAGFDTGVAARLDARAPVVLAEVSAFSPGLDPTGLGLVRARNDVTGPSFKVSYMTPRYLGFRLGASFTPEANLRGADFDPTFKAAGLGRADLKDVVEGALSFVRNFTGSEPGSGLFVRAAVTATHASAGSSLAGFGDYNAWGAGLELGAGKWTSGLRWLRSDNAWQAGQADYDAWEWGLVRQGRLWRIGLEAGEASDRLTHTEGKSLLAGANRKINDHLDIGLAWTRARGDLPVSDAAGFRHIKARNDGVILELSVRK